MTHTVSCSSDYSRVAVVFRLQGDQTERTHHDHADVKALLRWVRPAGGRNHTQPNPRYSECGPWTSSAGCICKAIRNADSRARPDPLSHTALEQDPQEVLDTRRREGLSCGC